jgi:hypothetical protein
MFRRFALGCLILTVLGGPASYAQITQSSKVIKAKPPKKYKAPKVEKAPKPPKPAPTKLTPDEKAARKVYGKATREQRKAFVKQNKQQANQLKAQQKAVNNAVKQAKKQAKNNK